MIRNFKQLGVTEDARQPLADVTNAPELFGDISLDEDGEIDEDGDPDDEFGDPDDDLYGDPDMLSAYQLISGDVDSEVGGLSSAAKRKLKVTALGLGLTVAGLLALRKRMKARKAKKAAIRAKLAMNRTKQTIRTQANARTSLGKINRASSLNFFSLTGAKMNSSPIDPLSKFVADQFKVHLDRQNSDTPFYQETAQGVLVGPDFVCTANGIATNRFFTGLILQFGTNMLNASPSTILSISASIPTIDGVLTISTTPFVMTYGKGFDVRFLFFPWRLISNKPLPVLGQYSNAAPIVVTVSGLPAASAVNLVVPGSLHPWTVSMRNALI